MHVSKTNYQFIGKTVKFSNANYARTIKSISTRMSIGSLAA